MVKIFNKDFFIDLQKSIIWQYDKTEKLKSLIVKKEEWYKKNVTDFINDFYKNVFNIDTANEFGLTIWGKLLNFSRYISYTSGVTHYLTTEEYRFLLKAQVLRFKCNGTAPEINEFLYRLFDDKEHQCYVQDNLDMTITYVLRKDFSDKQWLIDWLTDPSQTYLDWLPRPAGVRISIITGYKDFLGFDGMQTITTLKSYTIDSASYTLTTDITLNSKYGIYKNDNLLEPTTDYTITNDNEITFTTQLQVGDVIEIKNSDIEGFDNGILLN